MKNAKHIICFILTALVCTHLHSQITDSIQQKYSNPPKETEQSPLVEGITDEMGNKQGPWIFYFTNGHKRIECFFNDNIITGKCQHFYPNGQLKCKLNYSNGTPIGLWKSYYLNATIQGEILWNNTGIPSEVKLYYERERLAIIKTLDVVGPEISIRIKSYYENGAEFESYTLYKQTAVLDSLIRTDGIRTLVNTKPNLGINRSLEGEISGFYYRKFNTAQDWMILEFDNGKLKEVISQNDAHGNPIESPFENGNGTVIHFHHYKDTAAIINYRHGFKHGPIKYFHKGNNTFRTGFFSNGNPSDTWITKSYSGKLKTEIHFLGETEVNYVIYGPKNHKSKSYSLKNHLLNGTALTYDFHGDTAAVFNHSNGFLNGNYTSYLNGSITRYGDYINGEQIGEWKTKGLFNDVSHSTHFGKKQVIYSDNLLPKITFPLEQNIDIPLNIKPTSSDATALSPTFRLYNKNMFIQLLLTTPDSDNIFGTSFFKLELSDIGLLKELKLIKSPSSNSAKQAESLILSNEFYYSKFIFGFPDITEVYLKMDHYRW